MASYLAEGDEVHIVADASLLVRSDCLCIDLGVSMKTTGTGNGMDIGDGLYTPNVAEHMPGIANIWADHFGSSTRMEGISKIRDFTLRHNMQ